MLGRGEKSLLSGPGSELRLGMETEKKKCEYYRRDEQNQNKCVKRFKVSSAGVRNGTGWNGIAGVRNGTEHAWSVELVM